MRGKNEVKLRDVTPCLRPKPLSHDCLLALTRFVWLPVALISLLIAHSENTFAQIKPPLNVKNPISAVFPASKAVKGDLNNDGINDLAIQVTEETGNRLSDWVVIYRGKHDGSYDFFAKSQGIQYGTTDLKIRRKSLYITVFHNSLKESYNEVYQFKYLAKFNGFFLIGKEESSHTIEDGGERLVSINYLTGKKIEVEKTNSQSNEIKSQLNVKERKLIKLEEFGI